MRPKDGIPDNILTLCLPTGNKLRMKMCKSHHNALHNVFEMSIVRQSDVSYDGCFTHWLQLCILIFTVPFSYNINIFSRLRPLVKVYECSTLHRAQVFPFCCTIKSFTTCELSLTHIPCDIPILDSPLYN